MPPKLFPLRCESAGDQWWFASPIDCAAASGHYDLVRELLQIDGNLIFKLTSLARIRRLETVWDDDGGDGGPDGAARCRSRVARSLWRECDALRGRDSLIRAGYGGWLMYAAAAAGDLGFVRELLDRDPLLVFGEGEYGVTDILYAAARGRSREVFRAVLDGCLSAAAKGRREEEVPADFRWEVMNRAVHAAARGGSLGILRELLGDGSENVLGYRDSQGSTALHTAAGNGQVEVVKKLISSYDIINSVDNGGNTALNVAAYRAHLAVVEVLISASPSSVSLTNNDGDTFLHMAVAGFRAPSFTRLDRHIDLLGKLVSGTLVQDIINVQNNDGRTALHVAVIENIRSDIIELIMSARYIDLNIRDNEGNTPLDLLLSKRPSSASSEILIRRLVSASGFFSKFQESKEINANFVSHLKSHGISGSPGTSFEIPDAEIVSHAGIEDARRSSCELMTSSEIEATSSTPESNSWKYKKFSSLNKANRGFKNFLRWLGKKERNADASDFEEDKLSFKSYSMCSNSPVPLRQQFSRMCSLPNNKRIMSLQGHNLQSPSNTKKKFAEHRVLPKSNLGSPSSAFSESSWPSPLSTNHHNKQKSMNLDGVSAGSNQSPDFRKYKMKRKHGSFSLGSMNNYFCLGGQGLTVETSMEPQAHCHEDQQSLVA